MSPPTIARRTVPPPLPPRIVHGRFQARYNCSCGDNLEANKCRCSACHDILRNDNSPCSYFGRCVEPLSWNIENELVRNQGHSHLFSTLPKELRDLIFKYALTDCKAQSLESLIRRNPSKLRIRTEKRTTNDIAVNLLRTCRAIYLETWSLPLSLNPYIIYNLQYPARTGMNAHDLFPWQSALISGLDITLQQTALEGSLLRHFLLHRDAWHPQARHQGVYVAPKRFKAHNRPCSITEFPTSFNSILVPVEEDENRHYLSHVFGKLDKFSGSLQPPWSSAMRVLRARPLTHLTLRISHNEWWTWTDDPNSASELQQLGLDPTVGNGSSDPGQRPTAGRMRALAECRRAGQQLPSSENGSWGYVIGQLPDLNGLELVLETFKPKRQQLENVVEAAKTWKFPIADTQYELVWDGEIGMSGWSMLSTSQGTTEQHVGLEPHRANQNRPWHMDCGHFDIRVLRFVRRRIS